MYAKLKTSVTYQVRNVKMCKQQNKLPVVCSAAKRELVDQQQLGIASKLNDLLAVKLEDKNIEIVGEPKKQERVSKPRLPSLDSLRFFLISYITVGHFISFATQDLTVIKLFAQVNVWVGAFFVLSGYVAGYTATELDKYAASPRIKPEFDYFVGRVAGFYPLFLLVQVLFGGMFVAVDSFYNGPLAASMHGFLSTTLLQAWFPAHAEIWNAPTWFLSALAFAMLILPHVLPMIASMRKKGLKILLLSLISLSLISKISYSYDLNTWFIFEGLVSPRNHPNMLLWNITRFNPFYCLLEVLMGVVASRLVMTDSLEGNNTNTTTTQSALWPAVGLIAITIARAFGVLQLNDALTRGLLFVPLFIVLLMQLHRNTIRKTEHRFSFVEFLSHPWLAYLGVISFPIFILHGPIGQVFYKKVVATTLWGNIMPESFFSCYLAIVFLCAMAVQKFFVENKAVSASVAHMTRVVCSSV